MPPLRSQRGHTCTDENVLQLLGPFGPEMRIGDTAIGQLLLPLASHICVELLIECSSEVREFVDWRRHLGRAGCPRSMLNPVDGIGGVSRLLVYMRLFKFDAVGVPLDDGATVKLNGAILVGNLHRHIAHGNCLHTIDGCKTDVDGSPHLVVGRSCVNVEWDAEIFVLDSGFDVLILVGHFFQGRTNCLLGRCRAEPLIKHDGKVLRLCRLLCLHQLLSHPILDGHYILAVAQLCIGLAGCVHLGPGHSREVFSQGFEHGRRCVGVVVDDGWNQVGQIHHHLVCRHPALLVLAYVNVELAVLLFQDGERGPGFQVRVAGALGKFVVRHHNAVCASDRQLKLPGGRPRGGRSESVLRRNQAHDHYKSEQERKHSLRPMLLPAQ